MLHTATPDVQFIGDNVDLTQKASHETVERKKQDHWFHLTDYTRGSLHVRVLLQRNLFHTESNFEEHVTKAVITAFGGIFCIGT